MNGNRLARRPEAWLLGALMVWGLAPIVVLIVHAIRFHVHLTGADGLIGADQLQYLAWARDAGSHVLAANLFSLPVSSHVYGEPLFGVIGGLWRLGLPLPLAYWLFKPVAVVVLLAGAAVWARRMFPERPWGAAGAVALALFMFTPLASIYGWADAGDPHFRNGLLQIAAELFPAGNLWGYLPSALAIGLMALSLLLCQRALETLPSHKPEIAWAAATALVASWLHPWEGVCLLLIMIGLGVWGNASERRVLAIPAMGTGLPLLYYLVLSKTDSAWKLAAHNETVARPSLLALLAALIPPFLIAALGVRRPERDLLSRAQVLWIPAALITYFAIDSFPTHALAAMTIPLAVFIVRGWQRLRLPAALGALTLAAATLPGIAYEARAFRNVERGPAQEFYLTSSDVHALSWVSSHTSGGVLAPTLFAIAVPSQTGAAVWVGHEFWSRDYTARSAAADALFGGALGPATARRLVRLAGARTLIADCSVRADLRRLLGPELRAVHRFGCAAVYEVRPA